MSLRSGTAESGKIRESKHYLGISGVVAALIGLLVVAFFLVIQGIKRPASTSSAGIPSGSANVSHLSDPVTQTKKTAVASILSKPTNSSLASTTVTIGPRFDTRSSSGRQASPPTEPLDIAFVVDTSSGMADTLLNLKTEIGNTLDEIATASGNDYRLALVTFGGTSGASGNGAGVTVQVPFTSGNRAAFVTALEALQAGASMASSATGLDALDTVVNNVVQKPAQTGTWSSGFRGNARRILVTVTRTEA